MKVFPNPAIEESVTIKNPIFNTSQNATLKVYAQNGQLLKENKVNGQQPFIVLNIIELAKGSYQLSIETKQKKFQETLIIP